MPAGWELGDIWHGAPKPPAGRPPRAWSDVLRKICLFNVL
jgi:hypothetical protein